MKLLREGFDVDGFFARLAAARERVLLLDYDGTIAPFHSDPGKALPYAGVCAALERVIAQPNARVVIVSGRRLEDLMEPLAMVPHTEAWASHGWEWITANGETGRHAPAPAAREALHRARALADPLLAYGARMEIKVASVAVHWRGLTQEDATRVRIATTEAWEPLADDGLTLLPFDHGLEILAHENDKGDAVRSVLSTCCEGAVCAYLGDDITDEAAFQAIGPHGLAVIVGEKLRATHATLHLTPPGEVEAFVERWASAGASR